MNIFLSKVHHFLTRWTAFSFRYAAWILCAMMFMALACAIYTSRHLGVHTDTAEMLSEDLPFRINLKHFKTAFPQYENTMLLVLDAPTPEQANAAAKRLANYLKESEIEAYDIYYAQSDDFFERNGLLYMSISQLDSFAERLAAAQPLIVKIASDPTFYSFITILSEAIEELRKGQSLQLGPILENVAITLNSRLAGIPRLLSWQTLLHDEMQKNNYREIIVLQPKLDYSQLFAAEQTIQAIHAAAQELELENLFSTRLRITGEVALSYEELQSAMHGAQNAGLLALIAVAIILFVALRHPGSVLVVLFSLLLGLLLTAAFATAVVGHLNLISIAFAVLYIGLGVDYAIHLLLRYRELAAHNKNITRVLYQAASDTGPSLVICALTTAIGFYAFIPTAYRGIAELGLISGTGMFISLVVTLTVVPAFKRYFSIIPATPLSEKNTFFRLLNLPQKWRKTIYLTTFLAIISSFYALTQVRFDYNLLNLNDPNGEAIQTFRELLADTNSHHSPWFATIAVDSPLEADKIVQQVSRLPEVEKAVTIADFVPEEQDEKLLLIDDIALTVGPFLLSGTASTASDHSLAQQRLALIELRDGLERFVAEKPDHPISLSANQLSLSINKLLVYLETENDRDHKSLLDDIGNDLLKLLPDALKRLQTAIEPELITLQQLPETLRTRWLSEQGAYLIAIYPEENINDNQALRRFVRAVQQFAPQASGTPLIILEAGEAVVQAFIHAFSLTLLGVILTLYLMLRNVTFVLLVLIPLLLAALFTVATTVLLEIPFNFANVIALPLLLGIGIDSGIHMVYRGHSDQQTDKNLMQTSTVPAIFYSALTSMVGFGSLFFSSHQGTASMGLLLAVGVMFILICVFIILPALLHTFGPSLKR